MSEPTQNIYQALLAAKQQMNPPLKNKKNPHFKSDYADLPAVLAATDPALHAAGIVVVERLVNIGSNPERGTEKTYLEMSLVLASDPEQKINASWPIANNDNPQKQASSLTYGRRYLRQTLCGLAAEDDDGNAASRKPNPPQKPPQDPRDLPGPKATPPAEPPPAPEIPEADQAQTDELVGACKLLWEKYEPKLEKFAAEQGSNSKREFWQLARGLGLAVPSSSKARWDYTFAKWDWEGFERMVAALSDALGNVRGMK